MQLVHGPVLTYSKAKQTWHSTYDINVEQVRRLTLENDYLWVYPVLRQSRMIVLAVDVQNVVSQLLLKRSVYVQRNFVQPVREALRRMERGNQV